MLTSREVFDKVKNHLLKQKARSMMKNGALVVAGDKLCAYRGEGGLQCAVGCLIKDEFYYSSFEGLPVRQLSNTLKASGIDAERDMTMLMDLQRMHDMVPVEFWALELNRIENRYFHT